MQNVSLSALLDWNACARKYVFSREERLRLRVRPAPPGSGEAVHAAIEAWTERMPGTSPGESDRVELATEFLDKAFNGDSSRYGKFVRGAAHAISLVPNRVWLTPSHFEYDVSYTLGDLTVRGRVDRWADTPEGIVLEDFKVSESEPLDHMLWSPQIRYYALMLQGEFPDRAIHYRYTILPTQKASVDERLDWPFTRRVAERTQTDFDQLIMDYVKRPAKARPAYSRAACGYCDFKPICQAILTGGDPDAVKTRLYLTRAVQSKER